MSYSKGEFHTNFPCFLHLTKIDTGICSRLSPFDLCVLYIAQLTLPESRNRLMVSLSGGEARSTFVLRFRILRRQFLEKKKTTCPEQKGSGRFGEAFGGLRRSPQCFSKFLGPWRASGVSSHSSSPSRAIASREKECFDAGRVSCIRNA